MCSQFGTFAEQGIRVALLCIIGVTFTAGTASASGPATPAVIVEKTTKGLQKWDAFENEDIEIGLQSDGVEDLQVTSVVEDAEGEEVEKIHFGKSVIPKHPGDRSLHPDVVVAQYGDVVPIKRPKRNKPAPGVYSETISVAVTDADYDVPVNVVETRFFRVTSDGVEQISSEEYSREVDGTGYVIKDSDGADIVVHDGKSAPKSDKKSIKKFQPIVGEDGNIKNLDKQEHAPPARTNGDRSEVNED